MYLIGTVRVTTEPLTSCLLDLNVCSYQSAGGGKRVGKDMQRTLKYNIENTSVYYYWVLAKRMYAYNISETNVNDDDDLNTYICTCPGQSSTRKDDAL